MKIDMHCHTAEGSPCASTPVNDIISSAIASGIDGLVLTDHENINSYLYLKNNNLIPDNIVIYSGFEYTTAKGDFLVILPNDEDFIPYKMMTSPEDLIDSVHALDGIIGIPHMFKDAFSLGKNLSDSELRDIIEKVDFIETENGRCSHSANLKAKKLAREYKKFCSKGSDAHNKDELGTKSTYFETLPKSNPELISLIKESSN